MVAAEAAAAGSPPLVARHSGLAEVAAGIEAEYPPERARPRGVRERRRRRAARRSFASCWRCRRRSARSSARAARAAVEALELGARRGSACSQPLRSKLRGWATHRSLTPEEQLRFPRATRSRAAPTSPSRSRRSSRSSIPRRSSSTTASRSCRRPRRATTLEEHLVGELIASEAEVRTGRCESSPRPPRRWASGARSSASSPTRRDRARRDGHASVEQLAGPADHRHAALPAERRDPPLRRLAQQHASGCTSTSASAAPTGRSPSTTRSATSCPSCSRSRPARRSSRASTAASTRRGRRSSRACSRAADPGHLRRLGGVRGVRPLPLRDALDRRAHAALVERPAAPRVPDGRDPDLRRAARPRRGAGARGARSTRSRPGSRAPSTRASRCPTCRTGCSRRTSGARSATGSRAS